VKRILQAAAVAVLAGLIAVLAISVRDKLGRDSFPKAVAAGKLPAAPALDLPGVDGGRVRLADYRGRPVVVNFWASWCAPCEDEAPLLREVARTERARGVAFVGVDVADVTDKARAFVRRYGLDYAHARASSSWATTWGVTGQPETFVLDGRGRAVAWFPGPIEPGALRAAIAKAAA
jgi:cytochrome c biogenesis protein CcmG/thiol:disulfide interchange protein DsbE